MSSNRHLARIIALQSLYEYEFRTSSGVEDLVTSMDEIIDRNLAVYTESMSEDEFVRDLIAGTLDNLTKADGFIAPAAPEWPIDQIAKMDLTILRLAVYELMIKREVPPKVVINEAVELAKSFGGDNSSKFINGVLGTIYRQSKFYDPTEDHKVQRELGHKPASASAKPDAASQETASSRRSSDEAAEHEASSADAEPASDSSSSDVDGDSDQPVAEPSEAKQSPEPTTDEPSTAE